jgi:hypothetical protein
MPKALIPFIREIKRGQSILLEVPAENINSFIGIEYDKPCGLA